MSKLSFRARALDASKPLPIYQAEEIPDTADCSLINRAVPQMPTGMEKEEESEHHLQRAICAGIVIPTPEVFDIEDLAYYNKLYPEDYKMPRQLIYMQPFSMEADIPDYDMDSEDEHWVNSQAAKLELTPDKFEEMMDRLEKGSGQTVVTLQEAKALIKVDDDLIIAVYDYWLNKRLKTQHPLIPQVRTEARFGVSNHNPYIAFRRRTEKMQTRKNRKNDESSYEKMLKLKRDLSRAVTLLEMVKRREKSKRELLHLTIEVFEKRYQAGDFNGQIMSDALMARSSRPAFTPLFQANHMWNKESMGSRKDKRHYNNKKKKHRSSKVNGAQSSLENLASYINQSSAIEDRDISSEEEIPIVPSPSEEEEEDEGNFTFRRKANCDYHAPAENGNYFWCSKEEGGSGDKRFRFCPTSISSRGNYRYVGPSRRRIGRGGRVILDRLSHHGDDFWRSMGYEVFDSSEERPSTSSGNLPSTSASAFPYPPTNRQTLHSEQLGSSPVSEIDPERSSAQILPRPYAYNSNLLHFRPKTPEASIEDEEVDDEIPVDEGNEEEVGSELKMLDLSSFVGAMVSAEDHPLVFNLESLISDPNPLITQHTTVDASYDRDPVLLDERSSDLVNSYYLLEDSPSWMDNYDSRLKDLQFPLEFLADDGSDEDEEEEPMDTIPPPALSSSDGGEPMEEGNGTDPSSLLDSGENPSHSVEDKENDKVKNSTLLRLLENGDEEAGNSESAAQDHLISDENRGGEPPPPPLINGSVSGYLHTDAAAGDSESPTTTPTTTTTTSNETSSVVTKSVVATATATNPGSSAEKLLRLHCPFFEANAMQATLI